MKKIEVDEKFNELINKIEETVSSQQQYNQKYSSLVKVIINSQSNLKLKVINQIYHLLTVDIKPTSKDIYASKFFVIKLIRDIMLRANYSIYMMVSVKVLPCLITVAKIQNSSKDKKHSFSNSVAKYKQLTFFKPKQQDYQTQTIKLCKQILLFFGGIWHQCNIYHPYSNLKFNNIFLRAIHKIPQLSSIYSVYKNSKILGWNFQYFRSGEYQFYISKLQIVKNNQQYNEFLNYLNILIENLFSYKITIFEIQQPAVDHTYNERIDFLRRIICTGDSVAIKFIAKIINKFFNLNCSKLIQNNHSKHTINYLDSIAHIIKIINMFIKVMQIQFFQQIKSHFSQNILNIFLLNYQKEKSQSLLKQKIQFHKYITNKIRIWNKCSQLLQSQNLIFKQITNLAQKNDIQSNQTQNIQIQLEQCKRNLKNVRQINQQKKFSFPKQINYNQNINIQYLRKKLDKKQLSNQKYNQIKLINIQKENQCQKNQKWLNESEINFKVIGNIQSSLDLKDLSQSQQKTCSINLNKVKHAKNQKQIKQKSFQLLNQPLRRIKMQNNVEKQKLNNDQTNKQKYNSQANIIFFPYQQRQKRNTQQSNVKKNLNEEYYGNNYFSANYKLNLNNNRIISERGQTDTFNRSFSNKKIKIKQSSIRISKKNNEKKSKIQQLSNKSQKTILKNQQQKFKEYYVKESEQNLSQRKNQSQIRSCQKLKLSQNEIKPLKIVSRGKQYISITTVRVLTMEKIKRKQKSVAQQLIKNNQTNVKIEKHLNQEQKKQQFKNNYIKNSIVSSTKQLRNIVKDKQKNYQKFVKIRVPLD